MNKNIGKGTEEFMFFGDFFKYVGNFYIPENNDRYWDEFVQSSNQLLNKYSKCEFFKLVEGLVHVFIAWNEAKIKNEQINWKIRYKKDGD